MCVIVALADEAVEIGDRGVGLIVNGGDGHLKGIAEDDGVFVIRGAELRINKAIVIIFVGFIECEVDEIGGGGIPGEAAIGAGEHSVVGWIAVGAAEEVIGAKVG